MPKSITCCVRGCRNNTRHVFRWEASECPEHGTTRSTCPCQPPFRFFRFPSKRTALRRHQEWANLVNRIWTVDRTNVRNQISRRPNKSYKTVKISVHKQGDKWAPTYDDRVCSAHFVDGEPTDRHPNPTLLMGYDISTLQLQPNTAQSSTTTNENVVEIDERNNSTDMEAGVNEAGHIRDEMQQMNTLKRAHAGGGRVSDEGTSKRERQGTEEASTAFSTSPNLEDLYISMPKSITCCVRGCRNNTRHVFRWEASECPEHGTTRGTCPCQPPFRFFRFPSKRTALRRHQEWANLVNRIWTVDRTNVRNQISRRPNKSYKTVKISVHKQGDKWAPTYDDRVCSAHFVDGEPTDRHPNPTLLMGYDISTLQLQPNTAQSSTTTNENVVEIDERNNSTDMEAGVNEAGHIRDEMQQMNTLKRAHAGGGRVSDEGTSKRERQGTEEASTAFSTSPNLEDLQSSMSEFVRERGWGQYHTPRNILLALVGEVGELSELFQWKGEVKKGLPDWSPREKENLEHELSDVLLYLVRLADRCGVDLPAAAVRKMQHNRLKYPVGLVYGSSKKYNEYTD